MSRTVGRKGGAAPLDRNSRQLIGGFWPVREILMRAPHLVETVWVSREKRGQRSKEIEMLAQQVQVPLHRRAQADIDERYPDGDASGILAEILPFRYASFDGVLESARGHGSNGLLLALDHITDPGNLGALLRTAAFFGVQGAILPKDRAAGVTEVVLKRSAGACFHVPVVRVVNLSRSLGELSNSGFWIVGSAGEAVASVFSFDWRRPLVLVLGNEEKGVSPGVRRRCHELVRIPGTGAVSSLNVAVAAGAMLSEIFRTRSTG